ncbi:MAG TPA: hypothetical protein VG711_03765 [Phycisphaerales bacterium]|nr:hypothetical protein [Phycisphaerales bacterium]
MGAAISPDGRWVAFTAAKDRAQSRVTLKKMALDDGRPIESAETLCELATGGWYSLCWSSTREIVLAADWQQTIFAVSAGGGEPRVVLKDEQSKGIDTWGEIRPLVAGKSILASRWALVDKTIKERIEVVDLASGERTPLLQNAGSPQLVADGYLIARRNPNTLIAARLDLRTLKIIGEPITVFSGGSLSGRFSVSNNGTLAMTMGSGDNSGRRLMWLDEQGQPRPVDTPPRAYSGIAISPDGARGDESGIVEHRGTAD